MIGLCGNCEWLFERHYENVVENESGILAHIEPSCMINHDIKLICDDQKTIKCTHFEKRGSQ